MYASGVTVQISESRRTIEGFQRIHAVRALHGRHDGGPMLQMAITRVTCSFPDFPNLLCRRFPPTAAPVSLAVVFLLSSTAAVAEPVRLITSGNVYQIVEDGETGFTFAGSGFTFNGEVSSRPASTCGPCMPGTAFDLSATMTPRLFPPGTATIDGRTYDAVFFSGTFNFEAGSVSVPEVPMGGPGVYPTAPFSFDGTLAGYADASLTGAPLFSTALAGGGMASIGFFNYGSISADGFSYTFEDTAPVPEPGSLLLFGSGAAWIASRWRSRRRSTAAA